MQTNIEQLRLSAALLLVVIAAGCRTPTQHRTEADASAYGIIAEMREGVYGAAQPFTIEPPSATLRKRLLLEKDLPTSDPASLGSRDVTFIEQWPDKTYTNQTTTTRTPPAIGKLTPTLNQALQIAARNSREYQAQKETVFATALDLDLERDAFRNTLTGILTPGFSSDNSGEERVEGITGNAALGLSRTFKSGGSFALNLGLDLVKLLTQDKSSALGAVADATINLPLLRGSGRFVVTEPLTQAERDVVYAINTFERFKRSFAVQVASDYLQVLQQLDQVENTRDSYDRLVEATKRSKRLAEAGRLPEIQVDQVKQDELRARNRMIAAQFSYDRQLDAFKVLLGLPPDVEMKLVRAELSLLADRAIGLLDQTENPDAILLGEQEVDLPSAIRLALDNRLDLRTSIARVNDAQRAVAIAADQLRADLNLLGAGSAGESRSLGNASLGDADLSLGEGRFSASAGLDLPTERTLERNRYRLSLIAFEAAVRALQEQEDQVKLDIRNGMRTVRESAESVIIQAAALEVARRRKDSTTMFLDAGRAEVRDVLEAEESLVSARNSLSSALVQYRVGELRLQRDMGTLEIDETGLWKEFEKEPE